jgi:hypothetical protein
MTDTFRKEAFSLLGELENNKNKPEETSAETFLPVSEGLGLP